MQSLMFYLESIRGKVKAINVLQTYNIIVQSLKACQSMMINDRHCFECYGYDVLIDNNLKPWLLEVNASHSLTTINEKDRVLNSQLLRDIFAIVVPPDWVDDKNKHGANTCTEKVSGFLIF